MATFYITTFQQVLYALDVSLAAWRKANAAIPLPYLLQQRSLQLAGKNSQRTLILRFSLVTEITGDDGFRETRFKATVNKLQAACNLKM